MTNEKYIISKNCFAVSVSDCERPRFWKKKPRILSVFPYQRFQNILKLWI